MSPFLVTASPSSLEQEVELVAWQATFYGRVMSGKSHTKWLELGYYCCIFSPFPKFASGQLYGKNQNTKPDVQSENTDVPHSFS